MSREKPEIPKQRKPCGLPQPTSSASFWHSEPSPLLIGHRSTRNLPSTADVVIIGSGMTGASMAHHLLHQGSSSGEHGSPSVVMLEAREACWGATGRVCCLRMNALYSPVADSMTRMADTANLSFSSTPTTVASATSSSPTTMPFNP